MMSFRIGKLQLFLIGPLIVVGGLSIILVSILSLNQSRTVLQRMGKEVALESVDFISVYLNDIDASVSKTILYSVPNYQNFIVGNKNTNKKNLIRALFFLQKEKKYLRSLYLAYPEGGGIGVTYDYKQHGYYAFFTKTKRAGPLYRYRLNSLGEFSKYIGRGIILIFEQGLGQTHIKIRKQVGQGLIGITVVEI